MPLTALDDTHSVETIPLSPTREHGLTFVALMLDTSTVMLLDPVAALFRLTTLLTESDTPPKLNPLDTVAVWTPSVVITDTPDSDPPHALARTDDADAHSVDSAPLSPKRTRLVSAIVVDAASSVTLLDPVVAAFLATELLTATELKLTAAEADDRA